MKNYKLNLKPLLLIIAVMLIFFSCKKEGDLVSKELLVYVAGNYTPADNKIVLPFVHNPLSVSGSTRTGFAASATREVPADIDVTFEEDFTLVTEFNENNSTSFLPLPKTNYRVVNPGKYKIGAGTSKSDSLMVEILKPEQLTDPRGYLLPFTITTLEGKDKGAKISTNKGTVYINVTYEYNNIEKTQTSITGTLLSRTPWILTVSNTTSGALGPAMIDGSNTTSWRSSNRSTAAKCVSVDMGSEQQIKGFRLTPNYTATAENATTVDVSTSMDNVTWAKQGTWQGTGPVSGSNATNPDLKGINFISPVKARYFRLDIIAWTSGNRVGIAELNIVQ